MLQVLFRVLMPAILILVCFGACCVSSSTTDVWLLAGVGLFEAWARSYGLLLAQVPLDFVLGPMLEEHFRRAMLIFRRDPAIFLSGSVSASLVLLTIIAMAWSVRSWLRRRNAGLRRQGDPARRQLTEGRLPADLYQIQQNLTLFRLLHCHL